MKLMDTEMLVLWNIELVRHWCPNRSEMTHPTLAGLTSGQGEKQAAAAFWQSPSFAFLHKAADI